MRAGFFFLVLRRSLFSDSSSWRMNEERQRKKKIYRKTKKLIRKKKKKTRFCECYIMIIIICVARIGMTNVYFVSPSTVGRFESVGQTQSACNDYDTGVCKESFRQVDSRTRNGTKKKKIIKKNTKRNPSKSYIYYIVTTIIIYCSRLFVCVWRLVCYNNDNTVALYAYIWKNALYYHIFFFFLFFYRVLVR